MSDPTNAPADPNFGVGGSYIREADGTLTRADAVPAPEDAVPVPEKAMKTATKQPVKES